MSAYAFEPPCEFCRVPDGAHSSTCALALLARDIEIHAGPILDARPLAAYDASVAPDHPDAGGRDDYYPDFINPDAGLPPITFPEFIDER